MNFAQKISQEGYMPVDMKHENVLSTIGHTPVVRIRAGVPDHVEVYAKLEAFNPGGSVKDRLALGIHRRRRKIRCAQARADCG